jgi:DNA polymerase III epsilon subunit-like protein
MGTTWTPTPMDFRAGPMVWIDCEMTGLNPKRDKIMEIAVCTFSYGTGGRFVTSIRQVLITNGDLQLVDEGVQYVVYNEKDVLDGSAHIRTNESLPWLLTYFIGWTSGVSISTDRSA